MSDPSERLYDLSRTAVAVKGQKDGQAVVTAKGQGAVAEEILNTAFANDVKVREDKALTQMLSAFDIDSPIPSPALDAVCAVLVQVYAASQKMRDEP